ncbi:MAG: hypothetical protein HW421_3035 [Ignavibacteria bacterium]|nr:hypothetical protein [Ignavibacteria bacterium]
MFNKKDKPILEFVLQMIDEAERVIERHGNSYLALDDFEGRNLQMLSIQRALYLFIPLLKMTTKRFSIRK